MHSRRIFMLKFILLFILVLWGQGTEKLWGSNSLTIGPRPPPTPRELWVPIKSIHSWTEIGLNFADI